MGEKFHLAQLPLYCRNIHGIYFRQCGKSHHIVYVLKNFHQDMVAKLAEVFSWRKFTDTYIHTHTVTYYRTVRIALACHT